MIRSRQKTKAIQIFPSRHEIETDIAEMWKNHYDSLLNSSHLKLENIAYDDVNFSNFVRISVDEIQGAVKQLKLNKSAGSDGIEAEHLKYANSKLYMYISILFNSMISHNFLPSLFMDTFILPIVKDKKESISNSSNYRPIAITSIISKLFEIIVLERYRSILVTSPNQFGFKRGHGTESCLFVFKQIIDFYKRNSSPVYVTFLDLSKAFDRVNHKILFKKLLQYGLHPLLVRLFHTWYSCQSFRIKWGSTFSSSFQVSNGTRQGSVLSPTFFNIYMDELSHLLKNKMSGCFINSVCFNHLLYADDMVLLAPSASALQSLVDLCSDYIKENDLLLNCKKSKYMVFKNKLVAEFDCPKIYIDNAPIDLYCGVEYLGMQVRDDFLDDDSVISTMKGIYSRSNLITKNFSHCCTDVKVKLFKNFCCNFYCCSIWNNVSKPVYDKIKVSHNDALRMLFRIRRGESISQQFLSLGISNFDALQRNAVLSLHKRLFLTTNELVLTILDMCACLYGVTSVQVVVNCVNLNIFVFFVFCFFLCIVLYIVYMFPCYMNESLKINLLYCIVLYIKS